MKKPLSASSLLIALLLLDLFAAADGRAQFPSITAQPADRRVAVGGSATFTVGASGSSLSYYWRSNGVPVGGATTSNYTVVNVQLSSSGSLFSCLVSNTLGTALSSAARLTVTNSATRRYAIYGAPSDDNWNDDVLSKVESALPLAVVDAYLVKTDPVPTLAQLQKYDAVLVYPDSAFSDYVAMGNVLADYLDAGGGVVLSTFSYLSNSFGIGGRIVTGGYLPITLSDVDVGLGLTLVADQPAHSLLAGVSSFNGGTNSYHNSPSTITSGATLVAHWSNGQPLVATKKLTAGTMVALNFYPPSSDARSDFWSAATSGGRLMGNALQYVTKAPYARVAYVRSTVGLPWDAADNEGALTRVFGTLWQDLRYETVVPAALFSPTNGFIWLNGSEDNTVEMATFITNNLSAMQTWVAKGGSLFINAGPNEGAGWIGLGFGITLTNSDFGDTANGLNSAHPIFNGPFAPVGLSFSGGYFSHASVFGSGLGAVLTNDSGRMSLAEKSYGAGHAMFGGMTLPVFQSPQPNATNLLQNILAYGASLAPGVSNVLVADADHGWYDATGLHSVGNSNYVAGHQGPVAGLTWRDWFVFDVPAFSGTVTGVDLVIKAYGVSSAAGVETFELHNVTTPIATLRAGGSGLVGIYADLADGPVYGSADIYTSDAYTTITIPLNAAGVNAVIAARASQIAMGGTLTSLDDPSGNEYVFGNSGSTGTDVQLQLNFGGTNPPVILTPPADQAVAVNGDATFSVVAGGSPVLTYQWLRNGANIIGATSSNYTRFGVQMSDSLSQYSCRVSNLFGTVISASAKLTVSTNLNFRLAVFGAPGSDSWNTDVVAKINAVLPNTEVNGFLVGSGDPVPTLAQLQQYSAVLVYSDASFNDNVALGNVLADYVDSGGGVVLNSLAFFSASGLGIQGRILTGGYLPFTVDMQNTGLNLTLLPDEAVHPILKGVTSFNGGNNSWHNSSITTTAGAGLVAHWSNGQPLVGTKKVTAGTVVGLNFYPPSSTVRADFWSAATDGGRLMANALTFASSQTFFANAAYLRSTNGMPWGYADNEGILTKVFGPNWQDLRYETVNAAALFAPTNDFIFMEGSDDNTLEMGLFLTNNLAMIENWVANGGSLFINAAPNEGPSSVALGFGVSLVNYPDFSASVGAVIPAHPIFNGPFTPAGTNFTGFSFAHADLAGPGLTVLLTNGPTQIVLAEKGYGVGHVIFGTMTLPRFHAPQPNATNLLANILAYGAGLWAVPGAAPVTAVDRGWYDATGFHDPGNDNYFTGHTGTNASNNARSFFVFNIPPFNGTIDTAILRINAYGVFSPSSMENLVLRDVTTPVTNLMAGGSGLTAIYADLANGVVYGNKDFFTTNSDQTVDIPLNAAFIAAATAARGTPLAIGAALSTIDAPSLSEYVFAYSGEYPGDVQLILTLGGTTPPTIVTQPISQTVPEGGIANFSAVAAGSPTLAYQWRKTGVDIGGANSSSYSINNVQMSHAGDYTLRVTNLFGNVTSAFATLNVSPSNSVTVLSNGKLVVTLNNLGARVSSITYQGTEIVRFGTIVSDWGLQRGTNIATFVRNENGLNTSGQPMAQLASSPAYAAYWGVYSNGGANLAVNRSYTLVPGFDVLRICQTFVNNSDSSILLRCFDTIDPDLPQGFYSMFADRYTIVSNSTSILVGRGVNTNGPLVVIMASANPASVVAASSIAYFGIRSAPDLNSFFATDGADSDGEWLDQTLDIGGEFYLPPGASASFVFYESFGPDVASAEGGILNNALGQPLFLVDSTLKHYGNTFQYTLLGDAAAYEIQVSTNLMDWQVLYTLPMNNGIAIGVDPAASDTARFYRARRLP